MIDPVKLINPKVFIEQHQCLIGQGYSGREAFDLLNEQYEQMTGVKRFTDYDTFRAAKSYHQNSVKTV
ncbi:hypothetical protein OSG_eHP30_00270 [environmental Halophage eHP-30]|nr:hypothetical protein OSG_eHP30_00270 [environmental Halophage eHP-30]